MHVLDAPPYSIYQNTMSRDEIVSQLMDKVNSGKVTITLGEITVKPSLQMQSVNGMCKEEDDDGVGAGVVAGVSIALFIVGFLIGIGLSFLLQWFIKGKLSKSNAMSYNKQQNEVIKN